MQTRPAVANFSTFHTQPLKFLSLEFGNPQHQHFFHSLTTVHSYIYVVKTFSQASQQIVKISARVQSSTAGQIYNLVQCRWSSSLAYYTKVRQLGRTSTHLRAS